MGVKRIMETFFAGMQDQSMSGFGGRIVNTPMGPFRWNDGMQLWENVNNGMVMNNISFQDSMMLMDYAAYDGGSAPITAVTPFTPGNTSYILYVNFAGSTLVHSVGGCASSTAIAPIPSYLPDSRLKKNSAPFTCRTVYRGDVVMRTFNPRALSTYSNGRTNPGKPSQ